MFARVLSSLLFSSSSLLTISSPVIPFRPLLLPSSPFVFSTKLSLRWWRFRQSCRRCTLLLFARLLCLLCLLLRRNDSTHPHKTNFHTPLNRAQLHFRNRSSFVARSLVQNRYLSPFLHSVVIATRLGFPNLPPKTLRVTRSDRLRANRDGSTSGRPSSPLLLARDMVRSKRTTCRSKFERVMVRTRMCVRACVFSLLSVKKFVRARAF